MTPIFRRATPADDAILLAMMREFYRIEHLRFDEEASPAALRALLAQPRLGTAVLIALDNGPAGYFVMTYGYSLEFHGRDALVDELYLREPFRGRGFGRDALEEAARICREEEGIAAIHLEVDRANLRAQEVYRRAGFQDHDRYLLTRWLTGL